MIFISEMDAYPWVQHYDDRLWVDFHAGLDDWQVRLHDVEYKLEDVAPTIEAAGGNWCGGQWCAQYRNADVTGTMTSLTTLNHKGSPPDPAYLRGLNLTHGHYYRILAMARNNVGVYMDEWCPSPWVLIDDDAADDGDDHRRADRRGPVRGQPGGDGDGVDVGRWRCTSPSAAGRTRSRGSRTTSWT